MLGRERRRKAVGVRESLFEFQNPFVFRCHLRREEFIQQLARCGKITFGRQFLGLHATSHHVTIACRHARLLREGDVWQCLVGVLKQGQRLRRLFLINQLVAALDGIIELVHLDGTAACLPLRHRSNRLRRRHPNGTAA